MNVIFLDVDYVLSSINNAVDMYSKTGIPRHGCNFPFDQKCLENLKYIVDETDAYLVISSGWRKYNDHMEKLYFELNKYDLVDRIIGQTKVLGNRVLEIKDFIENFEGEINFIILDDSAYMEDLVDYLINTNAYFGLTREDANHAIMKLRRELK